MIARSLRYYVEGILAVFYGRRVLLFMKDNGLVIVSIVGSLVLIGLIIYLVVRPAQSWARAGRGRSGRSFRLKGPLIEICSPSGYEVAHTSF